MEISVLKKKKNTQNKRKLKLHLLFTSKTSSFVGMFHFNSRYITVLLNQNRCPSFFHTTYFAKGLFFNRLQILLQQDK